MRHFTFQEFCTKFVKNTCFEKLVIFATLPDYFSENAVTSWHEISGDAERFGFESRLFQTPDLCD